MNQKKPIAQKLELKVEQAAAPEPSNKAGCKADEKVKILDSKIETKAVKTEPEQMTEAVKASQSCSKNGIKE